MPNAREYLRNKKKKQQKNKNDEVVSVKKEIRRYRILKFYKWLIVLAVLVGIVVGAYFVLQNKEFETYEVLTDVEREDTVTTQYIEFQGQILKYSKDGVSYVDAENQLAWSYPYEMQSPKVDICEGMAAVGDIHGTKIYVFDVNGNQGEISTSLPILKFRVSNIGTVAAVLEDGTTTWINLYDKDGGEPIAQNKSSLEISGYPLDIDISDDSSRVVVSYLQLNGSSVKTHIAFYNFGSVGQNYSEKLVSGKECEGVLFPETVFLNNTHAAAFGDDRFLIFEGKQIPEETKEVLIQEGEEIRSVFHNENYIGLVLTASEGTSRYRIRVYNLKGEEIFNKDLDMELTKAKIYDKQMIVFNDSECIIYNLKGVQKYRGSMGRPILDMIPKSRSNQYIIVDTANLQQIKLKWE